MVTAAAAIVDVAYDDRDRDVDNNDDGKLINNKNELFFIVVVAVVNAINISAIYNNIKND